MGLCAEPNLAGYAETCGIYAIRINDSLSRLCTLPTKPLATHWDLCWVSTCGGFIVFYTVSLKLLNKMSHKGY
jgi:hypothetical protein